MDTNTHAQAQKQVLDVVPEQALMILDWLRNRGGVAIWDSIDPNDPGAGWKTPALTAEGQPYPKPDCQVSSTPTRVVTDPAEFVVVVPVEVKRFHVAVRMDAQAFMLKCTEANTRKIEKALAWANKVLDRAARFGVLRGKCRACAASTFNDNFIHIFGRDPRKATYCLLCGSYEVDVEQVSPHSGAGVSAWYEFDRATREAVILVPGSTVPVLEWVRHKKRAVKARTAKRASPAPKDSDDEFTEMAAEDGAPMLFGNVPHQIEADLGGDAPRLAGFPLNILYTGVRRTTAGNVGVSCCYWFNSATFVEDARKKEMMYLPKLESPYRVRVRYDKRAKLWQTFKYRGKKLVCTAEGPEFDGAMIQTTIRGLEADEPVEQTMNSTAL